MPKAAGTLAAAGLAQRAAVANTEVHSRQYRGAAAELIGIRAAAPAVAKEVLEAAHCFFRFPKTSSSAATYLPMG
jgi:hypothetical protein